VNGEAETAQSNDFAQPRSNGAEWVSRPVCLVRAPSRYWDDEDSVRTLLSLVIGLGIIGLIVLEAKVTLGPPWATEVCRPLTHLLLVFPPLLLPALLLLSLRQTVVPCSLQILNLECCTKQDPAFVSQDGVTWKRSAHRPPLASVESPFIETRVPLAERDKSDPFCRREQEVPGNVLSCGGRVQSEKQNDKVVLS
jgi:hypothetical protein